jgi:hypothetical protein
MLKQFSRIKKALAIMLAVFFVATLTVASASACSNVQVGSNCRGYSNSCDHSYNSNGYGSCSNGCITGYSNNHLNGCTNGYSNNHLNGYTNVCSNSHLNGCTGGCSNIHIYECK